MYLYTVTILDGTDDNFVNVNRYDPDAVIELVDHNNTGDVYEIETAHNLDLLFEFNSSVSYTCTVI